MVHARDRYIALKRIADINPNIYGIVFCRTRKECKEVADKLMADGYNADALHGDLSQPQRDQVMNRFRQKLLQILVATDVAARGLDVNNLSHVINYNLPDDPEAYIHRSGRTGRAGKSGISISVIHTKEMSKMRAIEKILKKKFEQAPVPSGDEICEKQLFHLIERMEQVEVDDSRIGKFLPSIYSKLESLSREELIMRFVSVEFNRFLSYYKNAPDINAKVSKRDEQRFNQDIAFTRIQVNAGKKYGLDTPMLLTLINQHMRTKVEIGKIDVQRKFSFFDVDKRYEKEILKAFKNANIDGFPLKLKVVTESYQQRGSGPRGNSRPRKDSRPQRDSRSQKDSRSYKKNRR